MTAFKPWVSQAAQIWNCRNPPKVVQMHRHSAPANPLIQRALQGDAKPGGNITGFTDYDPPMAGKWLGMLTQIIPPVARVAVLFNPATRALCRSDGTRHRG